MEIVEMNRTPSLSRPLQGRTVAVVGDIYRFLVTGAETDGRYALWEAIVPPGGGPPPHTHSREQEAFTSLKARSRFLLTASNW